MKKLFTLLLAVLYLGVSSGMALQVHYCMDEVSEFTLVPSRSEKCSKCGMSGNDCCRDEVKLLKLEDAHKQSVTAYLLSQPVADISRDTPQFILPVYKAVAVIIPNANDPPDPSFPRRHIILCRFNV